MNGGGKIAKWRFSERRERSEQRDSPANPPSALGIRGLLRISRRRKSVLPSRSYACSMRRRGVRARDGKAGRDDVRIFTRGGGAGADGCAGCGLGVLGCRPRAGCGLFARGAGHSDTSGAGAGAGAGAGSGGSRYGGAGSGGSRGSRSAGGSGAERSSAKRAGRAPNGYGRVRFGHSSSLSRSAAARDYPNGGYGDGGFGRGAGGG